MTAAAAKRFAREEFRTETQRQEAYFSAVRTMFEVRSHVMAGNIRNHAEALAELRSARMVVATAHSAYMRAVAEVDRLVAKENTDADR